MEIFYAKNCNFVTVVELTNVLQCLTIMKVFFNTQGHLSCD